MTLQEPTGVGTRRFFVSYTREDRAPLQAVIDGVDRLNHDVWIDGKLTGGQEWWDEILRQLRECDAVIVAVSPALLESEAASAEREYARALGKPVLPVVVRPTLPDLLPTDLARLQLVDFSSPDASNAFQLASAVAALPPAPALPVPLPVAPPVPRSYVSDLAERVRQPSLTREEQVVLVANIRSALGKPSQYDAALEVLAALECRDDLYAATSREIEELRGSSLVQSRRTVPTVSAGAPSPPPSPEATGTPSKPPAHWVLSTVSFLVSIVIGAVALYYSAQVSTRWRSGDREGARKASSRAVIVAIIGIVVGGFLIVAALGSMSDSEDPQVREFEEFPFEEFENFDEFDNDFENFNEEDFENFENFDDF